MTSIISFRFYFIILLFNNLCNSEQAIVYETKDQEKSHQQKEKYDLTPEWKLTLAQRITERFLGNDPVTIFQNSLGLVANIFQVWGWIETRPDQKKKKEQVDINELVEEWNFQLADLNFRMESFKESFKQLNCRFDAVHATRKSISQECFKYILPAVGLRHVTSKSKSNYVATKPTPHST